MEPAVYSARIVLHVFQRRTVAQLSYTFVAAAAACSKLEVTMQLRSMAAGEVEPHSEVRHAIKDL